MAKPLKDAQVGDKAVISSWKGNNYVSKIVTIKRVNAKSVTTDDGIRWDYVTLRPVGDPGYGYSSHLDLWDEEVHPYKGDSDAASRIIGDLANMRSRLTHKQLAGILPLLEEVKRTLSDKEE
jgi:hypothetical protein